MPSRKSSRNTRQGRQASPETSRNYAHTRSFRNATSMDRVSNFMGEETDSSSDRSSQDDASARLSLLSLDHQSSQRNERAEQAAPSAETHRTHSPHRTSHQAADDSGSDSSATSSENTNDNFTSQGSSRRTTQSSRNTATSSQKSTPSARQRKQPEPKTRPIPKPNKMHAIAQVLHHQQSVCNLIPKLPFGRLIREIVLHYSNSAMRVTPEMLECVQEAAEIYLVQLFEDSYRCTVHRSRVTLSPKDMELALQLRKI